MNCPATRPNRPAGSSRGRVEWNNSGAYSSGGGSECAAAGTERDRAVIVQTWSDCWACAHTRSHTTLTLTHAHARTHAHMANFKPCPCRTAVPPGSLSSLSLPCVCGQTGENALIKAAMWGHLDAVQTLLSLGLDPNYVKEVRLSQPICKNTVYLSVLPARFQSRSEPRGVGFGIVDSRCHHGFTTTERWQDSIAHGDGQRVSAGGARAGIGWGHHRLHRQGEASYIPHYALCACTLCMHCPLPSPTTWTHMVRVLLTSAIRCISTPYLAPLPRAGGVPDGTAPSLHSRLRSHRRVLAGQWCCHRAPRQGESRT